MGGKRKGRLLPQCTVKAPPKELSSPCPRAVLAAFGVDLSGEDVEAWCSPLTAETREKDIVENPLLGFGGMTAQTACNLGQVPNL